MSISKDRLSELAKICKAVYAGPIKHSTLKINNEPVKVQKIIHGSFGRGFCRLFWNDKTVVIAFRGTRECVDWLISNFLLFPSRLKDCGIEGNSIKIHFGFQNTLNYTDKTTRLKAIDAICHHLDFNQLLDGNRKLIVTGHSLGGALATIFLMKLKFKYSNSFTEIFDSVVLFGTPAVGFKKFKEFYSELNEKTIRVINGSDVVPFTPPIFYCHVGKSIWYNKKNKTENIPWIKRIAYTLKLPIGNLINDHSISSYIQVIEKSK